MKKKLTGLLTYILLASIALSTYLVIGFACSKHEKKQVAPVAIITICPDCGQSNCIYQEINEAVKGEGTDSEIEAAIQSVCKERGITDEKTIDLLRANYYL